MDPVALQTALLTLLDGDATIETRRAAGEVILRGVEPALLDVFADRPLIAGLVHLGVEAIDKAEGGITLKEGVQLLGAFGQIVKAARKDADAEVIVAPRPTIAGILATAKAMKAARQAGG